MPSVCCKSFCLCSNSERNIAVIPIENIVYFGQEANPMSIQNIVLADDEAIQRNVLSNIIQKISPRTNIVLCRNGKEAWEAIRHGDADLLITDIRMPVMDGMELIRLVSSSYPQIKIILISAYQEFEYAKTAISCGISEYLIKPFRIDDIRKLLLKMDEEISRQKDAIRKTLLYESMLESSRKDAQLKLLSAMLDGRKITAPPDESLTALIRSPGMAAVIRWKIRSAALTADNFNSSRSLSSSQQERLLFRLKQLFSNGIFVPLAKGMDPCECRLALLIPSFSQEEVRHLFHNLTSECSFDRILFWAGISDYQENLQNSLVSARQQAEEMLAFGFYHPESSCIYYYADMNHVLQLPMISLSGFEGSIREAVHTGDLELLKKKLAVLKSELEKAPRRHPVKVRYRISSMIVSIVKELDGMISPEEYDKILNDSYLRYGSCDTFNGLFEISFLILEYASAYFTQESGQYDTVADVITFIKKHFTEDISLQQLADKVHFSANYLSMQIKKRTGMSYVSYLTALRTETACKMLTETDSRIADIASACGYRDSSYFNRIFSRKYGMSPEQYRKAHKKC